MRLLIYIFSWHKAKALLLFGFIAIFEIYLEHQVRRFPLCLSQLTLVTFDTSTPLIEQGNTILDQSKSSGEWNTNWQIASEKYPTYGNISGYYRVTTVRHWGENPQGVWTLNVTDGVENNDGQFLQWKLEFMGELSQNGTSGPAPPAGN